MSLNAGICSSYIELSTMLLPTVTAEGKMKEKQSWKLYFTEINMDLESLKIIKTNCLIYQGIEGIMGKL